jgi:penicillin-insensitive murein endopeptidase
MTRRTLRVGLVALGAIFAAALAVQLLARAGASSAASTCFGSPERGRLEGGAKLPLSGVNFTSYSTLGAALGRTYVHADVHAAMLAAYATLARRSPRTRFVYGETGLASGGRFAPHKTHQNGLSVDFMVPVTKDGRSVPLPTSALNRYGYDLEFDDRGRGAGYAIDFEAVGSHLVALADAAKAHGIGIRRVIFEVPLQQRLFETPSGRIARKRLVFSTRPAWVRHDEHYHVDFEVRCKPF